MQLLEDRILREGKVFPNNILKVDSFLNHQVDVDLLVAMGEEFRSLYASESGRSYQNQNTPRLRGF